jgi:hypothetical protein
VVKVVAEQEEELLVAQAVLVVLEVVLNFSFHLLALV